LPLPRKSSILLLTGLRKRENETDVSLSLQYDIACNFNNSQQKTPTQEGVPSEIPITGRQFPYNYNVLIHFYYT
jgi:hypothetical protein